MYIILSGNDSIYQDASKYIQQNLSSLDASLEPTVLLWDKIPNDLIQANDLVVTVGSKSAETFEKLDIKNTVIYSYVDKKLIPGLTRSQADNSWAGLVINQPIQRMVSVADQLISKQYKNKIIVAVSDENTSMLKDIQTLKPLENGTLEIIKVPQDVLAAKIIEEKLFNAAALIAIHDKAIWSGKSAKLLLRQAYKYKVPVIGYSKKFLKAGALISVSSSIEDIAKNTSSLIHQWSTSGKLSKTGFVYSDASIDVNKNIARALHVPLLKLESLSVEK